MVSFMDIRVKETCNYHGILVINSFELTSVVISEIRG